MKKRLRRMLTTLVGTYVLLCFLMFAFQRSLIYHPTSLLEGRDVHQETLAVDGAEIRFTVFRREGKKAFLYFGGNAEDVSAHRDEFLRSMEDSAIFLVHYRGYGGSSGSPDEASLHADAQAIYDHVAKTHSEITVVGRSLGTAVAVRIAANNNVTRLVLVTPYDSILNVAKSRFPVFPVSLMLKDTFEATADAPRVSAPTTLIVAEQDEIIGRERSDALHAAFQPGVARVVTLEGEGHNTVGRHRRYLPLLRGDD